MVFQFWFCFECVGFWLVVLVFVFWLLGMNVCVFWALCFGFWVYLVRYLRCGLRVMFNLSYYVLDFGCRLNAGLVVLCLVAFLFAITLSVWYLCFCICGGLRLGLLGLGGFGVCPGFLRNLVIWGFLSRLVLVWLFCVSGRFLIAWFEICFWCFLMFFDEL